MAKKRLERSSGQMVLRAVDTVALRDKGDIFVSKDKVFRIKQTGHIRNISVALCAVTF
jgi:hypothetical protein